MPSVEASGQLFISLLKSPNNRFSLFTCGEKSNKNLKARKAILSFD